MSIPNRIQQYIHDTAESHNVCTKNTILIEEQKISWSKEGYHHHLQWKWIPTQAMHLIHYYIADYINQEESWEKANMTMKR